MLGVEHLPDACRAVALCRAAADDLPGCGLVIEQGEPGEPFDGLPGVLGRFALLAQTVLQLGAGDRCRRENANGALLCGRGAGSGLERGACGVRDVHAGAQAQVRDHGREHQHGFAAVKAQTQLALRRARLFNGKQTHYSASKSSAETSTGLAGAAGCLMRLFWTSIRWARTRASSSAASSG